MGTGPWKYKINVASVFHNDTMTFFERRDSIVNTLRNSDWYKTRQAEPGDMGELEDLVDELADTDTTTDFDQVWDAIYDEADDDRAWIATTGAT